MEKLECPERSDEIYLARGQDVDPRRPILTGDVYEGITIPGVPDGDGRAILLTHPCSMRAGGGHLQSHVQMARLEAGSAIPLERWGDGNYRFMPLPELLNAGDFQQRAVFELSGRVSRESLAAGKRIACLEEQGILLLMQRLAFHFTRVFITTSELLDQVADIFEEANLLDEWLLARVPLSDDAATLTTGIYQEEALFDALLSEGKEGATLRSQLGDPMLRSRARRNVRDRMRIAPPT